MIMQMHGSAVALAAVSHASVAAHAHGDAVAVAVFLGGLGILLWAYNHARRFTTWLIAGAFFCITVGVTVWSDALVGVTSTPHGKVILGLLVLLSPVAFFFEGVWHPGLRRYNESKKQQRLQKKAENGNERAQRKLADPKRPGTMSGKDHHHRVRTPVIGAVFGTVFALGIVSASVLLTDAKEALLGAGQALAQTSVAVKSGKAQAALSHHQDGTIVMWGIAVFAVIVFIGTRWHRHERGLPMFGKEKDQGGKGKGGRGRGGQPAIGGGQRAIGGGQ